MEIFLTIIAAVVLAVSIVQAHTEVATPKPENLPSFGDGQDVQPLEPQPTPTSTPKTVQATPSAKPQANPNIDEYIYPGSEVITSSSQKLTLTSGDDPAKITSWYKAKIQSMNLNVNSFVATQANEKILNKLVGDNGQISINVEISRESTSTPVNITIGITSH